ncbi:hypothetical protein V9W64_10610 [Neisseria leonii]|uniref:Uncharacterized protein n=1 Tax=Neisseria leonii TaxID=2995413 RepID=A0A9X4IBA9_9NEIS|nr:hypothetical protein [Neisseria sp. 51.81]MDD9328225.1 hypothetical protein [Neisseria sp. 51.81]
MMKYALATIVLFHVHFALYTVVAKLYGWTDAPWRDALAPLWLPWLYVLCIVAVGAFYNFMGRVFFSSRSGE